MIYQVTWQDIIRPDETWLFEDEAKDLVPATIVTVGWVVYKDESNLIIASSKGDGGQFGDINCIPMAVVLEMKELTN
jgi:hypothetical protein